MFTDRLLEILAAHQINIHFSDSVKFLTTSNISVSVSFRMRQIAEVARGQFGIRIVKRVHFLYTDWSILLVQFY